MRYGEQLKEETKITPTTNPAIERDCSTQIIIAALNEEPGIGQTIIEMLDNVPTNRLTVVDGNSHDRTVEVAKNCGAEILFQDGTGKGDAIAMALARMRSDVKYVVLTDADYRYPAQYVPKMIEILEQHPDVGMVCGDRFGYQIEEDIIRGSFYFGNKMLAFAHNLFNGVDMHDPLTGLRVIRADLLRNAPLKSKGFDVEVELNHSVAKQGYKIVEVQITYRKRLGEKKLKLKHGVGILKRILLETTSSSFSGSLL